MCCMFFCFFWGDGGNFHFFGDTLTSNDDPFGVKSCNLALIFDQPIISKTVKYINQSDNSSCRIIGSCTLRMCRLLANVSVENMNPGVNLYGIVLDISESTNKNRYNKNLILIRFLRSHVSLS